MAAEVKRIHILGIPVDVVDLEGLQEAVEGFYSLTDNRQIVFLDMHELMRAKFNKERRLALTRAALIVPVSTLIVRAARFLKLDIPPMRTPYPFIIRLLGILEEKNKSIYLLGSTKKGIRKAESALRATYPGLQIVGRYSSGFHAERQKDIISAIKKASPALLLTSRGLKGRHLWVSRNRDQLAPGLSIWEESCLDVFSGRRSKPATSVTARLFGGFLNALIRPWRFFRAFRYLLFFILLAVERIRK